MKFQLNEKNLTTASTWTKQMKANGMLLSLLHEVARGFAG